MIRRSGVVAVALGLVIAACGGGEAAPTTSDPAIVTTTADTAPTTSSTRGTTTSSGPTSTIAYAVYDVSLDGDDEARAVVDDLYSWIGDRTRPAPDVPEGLLDHLTAAEIGGSETVDAALNSADVGDGRAGVVTAGDDIVLLADEGSGWRVVGASLPRFGLGPWLGESVRHVLVIGTDARPGQDQQNFRADSLHILSSNVTEGGGAVLGIPRDTYVEAPYGGDKFTNVNVFEGQQVMVELTSELSGLPIDGYLVTGFLNFQRLINDFGGVYVDVPFAFDDWRAEAYISAGYQLLWGDKALGFSRSRRLAGGDFTRSYHQGVVIEAALVGVQESDITALPSLLALLDEYTWTDLALGDLVTVAAGAFYLDPDAVGNQVLPGTITTRNGASVVVLTDGAEDLFRDLDDGMLTAAG